MLSTDEVRFILWLRSLSDFDRLLLVCAVRMNNSRLLLVSGWFTRCDAYQLIRIPLTVGIQEFPFNR